MVEKKTKDDVLAETLSRELGSPESRAAARMLACSARPPIIITEYVSAVGPPDEDGCPTGPVTCDSRTAEVNGKILVRGETESDADFRERCIAEVPAMKWGFVTMRGDARDA
jgi:hypothetical protein